MSNDFKDHFSQQAASYTQFRPHYPQQLFHYLDQLTSTKDYAWDCATGNGQAAIALSNYFKQVIATDASAAQIQHAIIKSNISYQVMPAEKTTLGDHSIDLITVAQAAHWFNMPLFCTEVKRVLKSQGIIAIWGYGPQQINAEVDKIITHFYQDIIGPYWPPERKLVEGHYRSLYFPFDAISTPEFVMEAQWTLEQLLGYLYSWSATQAYINTHQQNPINLIIAALQAAWGNQNALSIQWPLFMRIGISKD